MRRKDFHRPAGYIGAPAQRARAMESAMERGTPPEKCGRVKVYSAEERRRLQAEILARKAP